MKINLTRSYRSKNGNTVFVYAVSGTNEQLKQFAAAQGDNHRVDEATGTPLWFTTRCVGQNGTLIITSNNKVVPDMSQYDQADSLAKQYGGNLGQELAKAAAEKLIGVGAQAVTPATTPVGTPGLGKL
jgi:hypothetical protein